MLEIKCPYCGNRSQNEFSYGGDADIKRPELGKEIPLGEFNSYGESRLLTIITYGNGIYLSLQAKKEIEKKIKKKITVIDLRWLAPINYRSLVKNIEKCKNNAFY